MISFAGLRLRTGFTGALWAILLVACAEPGGPDADHFDEARTYLYPLFDSPEACEAAQPPDYHVNCVQWARFTPDGGVELVLTDIINVGTYEIRGRRVVLTMESSPEVPGVLEFTLSADRERMTAEWTGAVWILDETTDVWDVF